MEQKSFVSAVDKINQIVIVINTDAEIKFKKYISLNKIYSDLDK